LAKLLLAVVTLAAKTAHPNLAPADYAAAETLANRASASKSPKEDFEYNQAFWDIFFRKTDRPILCEVFHSLNDRTIRYYPFLLTLFAEVTTRPRHREEFLKLYRKGKIAEAIEVFRELYLKAICHAIDSIRATSTE
jgi:DNA-binding GntR family transcriptional regulator